MGSKFQDYLDAQHEAVSYAQSQRRLRRYTLRFVVFTVLTSLLTYLIAPKLVIPGLLFSTGSYLAYRFGYWAKNRYKQWRAEREASQFLGNDPISAQPLLANQTRKNLRTIAHNDVEQALIQKNFRISHYAKYANFHDEEPMGYADRKHQRALFQYHMLERTKEAALLGNEEFIAEAAHDKESRRNRKIDIVKKILNDFIIPKKVDIVFKSTSPHSSADSWEVTGVETGSFFGELEAWNNSDTQPFLPIPSGWTSTQRSKFIRQSLLPLILDADQVIQKITPRMGEISGYRQGTVQRLKHYLITESYLKERLAGLEKTGHNELSPVRS